jgi:hypothetical protein
MPRRVGPARNRCLFIGGSPEAARVTTTRGNPFFVEFAGKIVAFGWFECL